MVVCRLSAGLVEYGRQKPHTHTLMRASSVRVYVSNIAEAAKFVYIHSDVLF